MINKIYKRIHNTYLNFFNSFYFLRYVFVIFFIAGSLFLTVPKLFNYEKKQQIIEEYLLNNYDLELNNYETIQYKIFPVPYLIIRNADLKIKNKPINFTSNNTNIILNVKSIYNFKNFTAKKIQLKKNKVFLDISETKDFINYFGKVKYKLDVEDLNLNLKKNKNTLVEIKNIKFSNYGLKKNYITGKIFDKEFKLTFKSKNKYKNLDFKILNTGIKANFNLNEKISYDSISGSSKINLPNNLLRFDFIYKDGKIKISNSNFRNKGVSFSLDSIIKFNPFFSLNSNININEIDKNTINTLSLEKIIKHKSIIKKFNSKVNINYKNKNFFSNLIEEYSSELSLSYGQLFFSNKILITGGKINCEGNSKLTNEFPRLNFTCLFNLRDKRKLFKKLSIYRDLNKDPLNLNIEGSFNLFNKKINLKKIEIKENYLANEEDLKYFKEVFENTLFDNDFFQIFDKDKIKKFLLEII